VEGETDTKESIERELGIDIKMVDEEFKKYLFI
jgi:hypothetical protein